MKENLKTVLEFYRALGIESLPLAHLRQAGATGLGTFATADKGVQRFVGDTEGDASSEKPLPVPKATDKESALMSLREEIGDCQRCKLSRGRTHIVFGEGSVNARIMFIGEAPGREEDRQARPFVGDAGQLLTRLIEKMGLTREEVYIANIVKCRPPQNRDPQDDEIATCFPFVHRQVEIIDPRVVVSLGRISAHTLLGIKGHLSRFSITRVRGQFYDYTLGRKKIPLMPTFHPAYLLRNPKDKWLTWEDAQAVLRRIGGGVSG